jgi:hypothetical protein
MTLIIILTKVTPWRVCLFSAYVEGTCSSLQTHTKTSCSPSSLIRKSQGQTFSAGLLVTMDSFLRVHAEITFGLLAIAMIKSWRRNWQSGTNWNVFDSCLQAQELKTSTTTEHLNRTLISHRSAQNSYNTYMYTKNNKLKHNKCLLPVKTMCSKPIRLGSAASSWVRFLGHEGDPLGHLGLQAQEIIGQGAQERGVPVAVRRKLAGRGSTSGALPVMWGRDAPFAVCSAKRFGPHREWRSVPRNFTTATAAAVMGRAVGEGEIVFLLQWPVPRRQRRFERATFRLVSVNVAPTHPARGGRRIGGRVVKKASRMPLRESHRRGLPGRFALRVGHGYIISL